MTQDPMHAASTLQSSASQPDTPSWVERLSLLWRHRVLLGEVAILAILVNTFLLYSVPDRFKAGASIMPPDQQSTGTMMLAALARAGSSSPLGSLAGGLLGGHASTALYVDLLHSGTVSGHLIDRFNLQQVYHKRYKTDAGKRLAQHTSIKDDKKSGVITIEVVDKDPVLARDLAQGYLDELNNLVTQTSTSSAHQERIFIERRLHSVEGDLERAEQDLSHFSSHNSTIDIKEQTRAMVDAGAKIQSELVVEQAGIDSLRQIYGDSNIRVRESEARIGTLQHELRKLAGTAPLDTPPGTPELKEVSGGKDQKDDLYPPLRQLPRLAVTYTDLYRSVRVQEGVFELLTQQYEMARIEEAKDVPVVNIIDHPGVPERKDFPPRKTLILALTAVWLLVTCLFVLLRDVWIKLPASDSRRALAGEILGTFKNSRRTPPQAQEEAQA